VGKESRSETGLWDAVPDWNGRAKCGSPASRYCERGSKFCGSRRSRVAHFAMPGRFIMAFLPECGVCSHVVRGCTVLCWEIGCARKTLTHVRENIAIWLRSCLRSDGICQCKNAYVFCRRTRSQHIMRKQVDSNAHQQQHSHIPSNPGNPVYNSDSASPTKKGYKSRR
jgi:hypothetical protein